MRLLTEIQTIRFSKVDVELMFRLKKMSVNPDAFVRQAFREKIERDFNKLLLEEKKQKEKDCCPF